LRTLPQIDADTAAGIVDPTKPVPITVPRLNELADSDEEEDSDLDPDSGSDPDTDTDSDTDTNMEANQDPDSSNSWGPSIPGPDLNKKPS
jgi:hypothetical protein